MSLTLAKHTIFSVGDGAGSEVFTALTSVTDISWGGRTWGNEDTTNHDAATPVKTMANTLYSNTDYTLVIDTDPSNAQQARLKALSESGASGNFQVTNVNGADHVQFAGFVTSWQLDTPVSGLLKTKVKIAVNGAFTAL